MTPRLSRPSTWAAAAALPLLFVAARPLAKGMTYDFHVSMQSSDTRRPASEMVGRGQVAGGNARVDIIKSGQQQNPMFGDGGYILATGGGKTLTIVNPEKKEYLEMDVEQMMNGMNSMMNAMGGMMKFEISDVKVNVEKLGAGEKLQGYSTLKYRMTQDFTMNMAVMGMKSHSTNHSVTDYWFAPDLKNVVNPFLEFSQQMGQSALFKNSDFLSKTRAAQEQMYKGVPIKSVMTATSTDDKGKATTTTQSTEMTNIKSADIADAVFKIPAGYTKTEMPDMTKMAAAQQAQGAQGAKNVSGGEVDGAKPADPTGVTGAAKDGLKEGAQEAAKQGAKEKAGKAIRGLFGKKP